jgi:hypothetical protein
LLPGSGRARGGGSSDEREPDSRVASTVSRPGSLSQGSPEASGGPLHRILDDWRAAERRLAHAYDEASRAEVELEVGRLRREYQAEAHAHDEG